MTEIVQNKTGEISLNTSAGTFVAEILGAITVDLAAGYDVHKGAAINLVMEREPKLTIEKGNSKYTWSTKVAGKALEVEILFRHSDVDFKRFRSETSMMVENEAGVKEPILLTPRENNKLTQSAIHGDKIKQANNNQLGQLAVSVAKKFSNQQLATPVTFQFGTKNTDNDGNTIYMVQNETFRTPIFFLNGMKVNNDTHANALYSILTNKKQAAAS